MLNRKDLVGDLFDSQMRNYLKVVDGQKELLGKTPKEQVFRTPESTKLIKTLQEDYLPLAATMEKAAKSTRPLS